MDVVFGIVFTDSERCVSEDGLRHVAQMIGASRAEIRIDRNFGIGLQRNVVVPEQQVPGIVECEATWVGITGEIENLSELAAGLRRRGLGSESASDGEIVRSLYADAGTAFTESLYGYFSTVVWNRRKREVVLSADRCGGLKGMYYCQHPDFLAFGSTIKSVVAHKEVSTELDRTSLEDLLVLGYPISPYTMFRHVSALPAGCYLRHHNGKTVIRRYWRRNPWRDTGADLHSLEQGYFDALQEAVARCAGGDETSVMLSGGVDSAALVSLLRRMGHARIRTYSIHIGDPEKSDRAASLAIARHYGTEHHSLDNLDARCLEVLPQMIWHLEAPAQNIHPTYWLAHRMQEDTGVVLAGYGNDLIWGCSGPKRVTGNPRPSEIQRRYLDSRRRLDRRGLRELYPTAASTDLALLGRTGRFRARTGHGLADLIALDEGIYGDHSVCRELGKSLVDAHGIWPRLPYTDRLVTRFAESVPPMARLRQLDNGGVEFKSFFKDLVCKKKLLSPDVIYRRKTWMYSPTAQWLRGDLRRETQLLLLGRRLRDRQLFDHGRIEQLLAEHQAGAADHSIVLMMLVAVEIWHRIFVDQPVPAKPDYTLSECALDDRP